MAKKGVSGENRAAAYAMNNQKNNHRVHERTVASKQTDFILKNPDPKYDVQPLIR